MKENKPWGFFEVLSDGETCKVKLLSVNPGQRISLQSHSKRSEHWTIVKGKATISLDEETKDYKYNDYLYIPKNIKHRLENKGKTVLEVIEVQCGEYFGEDDIIRYADDYKRF